MYPHTVIGQFPSHIEAERVVLELQKEGFDLQKLSIIGKGYQTNEQVRGFLTWKDTAQAGAATGGYWGSFVGGLFGILAGAGVLFIPGIAPIVIAGPITGCWRVGRKAQWSLELLLLLQEDWQVR